MKVPWDGEPTDARASTGHQIIVNPRQPSPLTTVAETKKAQRIDTPVNPRIYS